MSITLNFELNDRDLAHFQIAMERAKAAANGKSNEEIVDCAAALLDDAQKIHIPDFIKARLLRLDDMIAMVRDQAWPARGRPRACAGSAHVFLRPGEVIPDHARCWAPRRRVMIETVGAGAEARAGCDDDFCDFREHEATAAAWSRLHGSSRGWRGAVRTDRPHAQRREPTVGTGYGGSSGYASGRASHVRGWRPGVFKFG